MPSVAAIRPTDIFTPDQWRAFTRVSRWRGLWLIVHAWVCVAAIMALALWVGHWLAYIPAILLIGGRQLGLAILMHDAAHGLTHPQRGINNFAGQWLSGAAVGSDLHSYRTYHLTHHRYTQQDEDPDLPLSAPFPTTRNSLIRKCVRDATGQTAFKQRRAQAALAWRGLRAMLAGHGTDAGTSTPTHNVAGTPFNHNGAAATPENTAGAFSGGSPENAAGALVYGSPENTAAMAVARTVGRFLVVQAVLLALSLWLWGWTPFLLWVAALCTSFQLALRIRNIAEHACTNSGPGDPFSHARTTRASAIERALVAPYWVNFHIEHHLFMGVPCYRLMAVHHHLLDHGYGYRMMVADSYGAVMRRVVAPA
ncbi:MAG: fatty acid desaturase family protein [Sphingopyxis sp.]